MHRPDEFAADFLQVRQTPSPPLLKWGTSQAVIGEGSSLRKREARRDLKV